MAALDLGTNNCRLLIARPVALPSREDTRIRVLDTFSRIVRLGEGLTQQCMISEDAMQRTLSALAQCRNKLNQHPVEYSRFVATEACRLAHNSDEFLQRVHDELGMTLEIISTEEEARLAFLGCSTLLDPSYEHALVFDIGGGSTEFLFARHDMDAPPEALCEHRIVDWFSLNQGVMNLSEKFGGAAFAEEYFDEIVGHIVKSLRAFEEKNHIASRAEQGTLQMLSTSGTLTTLAAIHLDLKHYERGRVDGFSFSVEELRDAVQRILSMRNSERYQHGCIGPDRVEYIISGCAIFEAICSMWPVEEITIADRGVREGILLTLMQQYLRTLI